MVGEKLSVTATAENGNEFDSEATDPVKADKAGKFELVDDQGFQDDGTALTTDTLRVSYGSDLGTPRHITWYNDGAVMAVYTLDANHLTQDAFNSDGCKSKVPDQNGVPTELAPGNWKVTIENTSGELWESNEVTVVYYGEAIMSDWSIEDDYDTTPMNVALAKTTGTAILNVTFNKNYAGTLYLIDSKIEKGYTGHIANKIDLGNGGDIESKLTEVKTITQLTNKNATAAAAAQANPKRGIYWEDPTGAVHCKLLVALTAGQTVTRGSSYYLVWDQDDNDEDDLKAATSKREDLNASDDMVVPYVKAPASIKVSTFATDSDTVKVDALDEDGEKLAWYTVENNGATPNPGAATLTNLGLTSAKIFKVDTNAKTSTDTSENAASQLVKEGVYTFTTAAAIPNAYVYVQLKTIAGVFAKDSITLESDLSESARDAVSSITLEEDGTDPTSAVVKFKGLSTKAPGKVYIMQGNNATDEKLGVERIGAGQIDNADDAVAYAAIAAHDLSDAIAEADVEGGASSVTIPNVFEYTDMEAGGNTYGSDMGNNAFVAVFVPEDEQLWKRANSLAADANNNMLGFQLKPVITTIDKSELAASLTTPATAGPLIAIGGIQAMDQFGNKWTGTGNNDNAASVSMVNKTATNTEDKAVVTNGYATVANNGIITLSVTVKPGAAGFDKGDAVEIKVPGLKDLKITLTAAGDLVFTANDITVDGATTVAGKVAAGATLTAASTTNAANGEAKLSAAFSIS